MGTWFPLLYYITVRYRVHFLFVCKSIFFVWFNNKRGSVAAVDQVDLRERNNITSLTYLNSTLVTGWSTAGVADSNLTKVFLL